MTVDFKAVKRVIQSKRARLNPSIAVAAWNNAVHVGQEVDYRSDPHAAPQRFKTRCHAEVLSGHTAVVWLEGKSGCVTLEACTPVPAPVSADERAALQKFDADAEDDVNIPFEMMARLDELGLVERVQGNWYGVSNLGRKLLSGEQEQQHAGAGNPIPAGEVKP